MVVVFSWKKKNILFNFKKKKKKKKFFWKKKHLKKKSFFFQTLGGSLLIDFSDLRLSFQALAEAEVDPVVVEEEWWEWVPLL